MDVLLKDILRTVLEHNPVIGVGIVLAALMLLPLAIALYSQAKELKSLRGDIKGKDTEYARLVEIRLAEGREINRELTRLVEKAVGMRSSFDELRASIEDLPGKVDLNMQSRNTEIQNVVSIIASRK